MAEDTFRARINAEIKKKVKPTVKVVAREKFNSCHIDRDDLQTFLDAISVTRIEPVAPSRVHQGQKHVETNLTGQEYLFPGNPSRQKEKKFKASTGAHSNLTHPVVGARAKGKASWTANEQLQEQPITISHISQRTLDRKSVHHVYKLHLTVQADSEIRVYCTKPLVIGASTVGILGALGGTAGGIAAGAAVGSIVPVAGTIVGGIVGGILGAVGGLIVGSSAGAGAGVGFGAVHSSRTYKMMQASEVFKKMQGSPGNKSTSALQCTIVANFVDPLEERALTPATKKKKTFVQFYAAGI